MVSAQANEPLPEETMFVLATGEREESVLRSLVHGGAGGGMDRVKREISISDDGFARPVCVLGSRKSPCPGEIAFPRGLVLRQGPVLPFGSLATTIANPLTSATLAHGFASQPRDWFAFVEDEQCSSLRHRKTRLRVANGQTVTAGITGRFVTSRGVGIVDTEESDASPRENGSAVGEAGTEAGEKNAASLREGKLADGFIERQGNRACGGVAVSIKVGENAGARDAEDVGDGVDDADVGLMRNEEIDGIGGEAGMMEDVLNGLRDGVDGPGEDGGPVHLQELETLFDIADGDGPSAATGGSTEEVAATSVGT